MQNHRSLLAWKEANAVVHRVLVLSQVSWKPWATAVFGQLQRASLSVQLNISEGYAQRGSRNHVWHLRVAYASAVETGDLLHVLLEAGIATADTMGDAIERNVTTQKLLWGLIRKRGGEGTGQEPG